MLIGRNLGQSRFEVDGATSLQNVLVSSTAINYLPLGINITLITLFTQFISHAADWDHVMEEGALVGSIDNSLCETCSKLSFKPTLHNRKVDDFELARFITSDGVRKMAVDSLRSWYAEVAVLMNYS